MHINAINLYNYLKLSLLVSKLTGLLPTDRTKQDLMKEVQQIRNAGFGASSAPTARVKFDLEQQKKERDAELEELRSKTRVSLVKQAVSSELAERVKMMAVEVPPEEPADLEAGGVDVVTEASEEEEDDEE